MYLFKYFDEGMSQKDAGDDSQRSLFWILMKSFRVIPFNRDLFGHVLVVDMAVGNGSVWNTAINGGFERVALGFRILPGICHHS